MCQSSGILITEIVQFQVAANKGLIMEEESCAYACITGRDTEIIRRIWIELGWYFTGTCMAEPTGIIMNTIYIRPNQLGLLGVLYSVYGCQTNNT